MIPRLVLLLYSMLNTDYLIFIFSSSKRILIKEISFIMSGIIMSYIHYVTYHIDVSVRFINLFFQKLIINSDFRRKNSRLFYGQYIAIQ